jgi:hypothetical protein
VDLYQSQGLQEVSGFHSTMHLPDKAHRAVIDRELKKIITEPAQSLLPGYRPLFANFIVKEPNGDSEVGVHQDWTYVDERQDISVNIWTPLTNTTEANGALYVLPGSHLLETPPRYTPFENTAYKDYNEWIQQHGTMICCEAGEAVVYDTRLIHFSFPNRTDDARLAINFVNIPEQAQPIHLYREPGSHELDCYFVDDDFFNTNTIDAVPEGYPIGEKWPLNKAHFSFDALEKLTELTS